MASQTIVHARFGILKTRQREVFGKQADRWSRPRNTNRTGPQNDFCSTSREQTIRRENNPAHVVVNLYREWQQTNSRLVASQIRGAICGTAGKMVAAGLEMIPVNSRLDIDGNPITMRDIQSAAVATPMRTTVTVYVQ